MSRALTSLSVAATVLALTGSLVGVGGADATTTPNAARLLASALSFGARQSSMTVTGRLVESGVSITTTESETPVGAAGTQVVAGVGTEFDVQTTYGHPYFVKATTVAILADLLGVRSPTASQVNKWYEIPTTDPRYGGFMDPDGAQNMAQIFSISRRGFAAKALYEGTATLKGVKVDKLLTKSNMWATGSALVAQTLYVTESAQPRPFATSGPIGTTGLVYFTHWGTATVTIPTAVGDLPG